ncbi:PAS domain S-box protein [Tolypothrix sp. FACHB-123]|uniref:PAS domain S-box protein n=1 Tax=Tolypothrix sp. FACHB-123 TaxID=2692868 RepID=UPI00168538F3|nr:PAS domain S-box protein [Tolypothrix sp. FACHB-123]MBD2356337.1 PAS domain S-box protein [Tolypothrix sp. FACHB-123]
MLTHRTVIVIIDADESDRDYEHQLQQDGSLAYKIITQNYSQQIGVQWGSQLIDGILLALTSPHADSINAIAQLQAQMGDRCPPIVVIDDGDAEMVVRAFKTGAADYLVREKMTPDDLRQAMRSAIVNAELKREFQRSQEQFQTSVENMLDCFGIFSAIRDDAGEIVDFRIDYLNAAACENNQMAKEMQIGRGLCELFPGHRTSGLFEEYCQLVATGEPLIKDSLIHEDIYGDRRLVRAYDIRASKLNDGFVASWRDISDRKRLELELRFSLKNLQQQQKKIQRLIETAPIGIAIGSATGEVKVINDAMLELHGYTRQEFAQQGMNWHEFIPPELSGQTEPVMAQLRHQGFLPPHEKELLRRDGTRVPIWISATQWLDGENDHIAFAIDLTEQKQAEAVIQQLNHDLANRVSELQTLFEIIPVGIAIATDPDCLQMQSNAYLRQLLGVSGGRNVSKSAPPQEQPPYRTFRNGQEVAAADLPMQMAARLGVDVRDAEFEILLADGTVCQMLAYATPLRDEQQQIRGCIGAFVDITERHQTAAALKASQQRYQELAEAMPQMVWTADVTGAVNYWNQRWYDYTGLTPAESMGVEGVNTVHPKERDHTLEKWRQSVANGQTFEMEYRIRRVDGVYHWFISRGVPTRDSQGKITGWIGTITDIDHQKQLEQKLIEEIANHERSQAILQAFIAASPTVLVLFDRQLRFLYANEALAKINGLPLSEHLGKTLWDVVPQMAPQFAPLLLEVMETQQPVLNLEFSGEVRPGVFRHTIANHYPVCLSNGEVIGVGVAVMDVTHLTQAKQELAASEARFRTLADNISQFAWMADANGAIFWYNQRWYDYTGTTLAEMTGWGWQKVHHPEHVERVVQKFRQAMETGEIWEDTFPLRGKDGQYRWFLSRAIPVYNEQGQVLQWFGTNTDITDLRQTEIALQEVYIQLEAALTAGLIYTWRWQISENLVFTDRSSAHLFGVDPETAIAGLPVEQFLNAIHPEDLPLVTAAIKRAIVYREDYVAEYRIINADGQERWVIARGRVEYDANGKAIAFPGVLADITDRKCSEAALRQSEDRLRMAIESAQLGTWDLNLSTNQLIWDAGCKAMFGLPPEAETSLEVFYAGLHPEDRDRLERVVQDALNPASSGNYDVEYRTIGIHDGIERWVKAKGQAYFDPAGHPLRFIGTVLDITEQKRAEAEREQLFQQEQAAREAAERANRIKDEFLAVLSHELRSPLNPILGWTKLLQSRKLDQSKTAEALATIERNVKLQTQLIDDLLDVAKILRGKLSLNLTSVNLSFIIAAAIDTVTTAATAKSISIQTQLPDIGQVSADAARLQQIVWNLLSNAVKFTPNGGRVDIELQKVGDRAEIIIKDTGKGISPDFLPHLFESFRQEDASITRKYGGLGLGLAIVRQLVEAHGGIIKADSPGIGLGATFTVCLPLLKGLPEIPQPEQFLAEILDLTGIRVLAVDDDSDARELLTVLLSQQGAEVVTVNSAAEVLATLEFFQPDVIVSDIGMPDVDGYTLIQQIRALPPQKGGQIPAIALTAYARVDDRQRALNSGYQKHVTKPLDPEKLVQAVIALTKN